MKKALVPFGLASLLFMQTFVFAQEASDLYLGKLLTDNTVKVSDLVRITDTDAYTNQPYFFTNENLFYTQMISSEEQMDVFSFSIATGEHKNLSQSPQSEYSPTPMPNQSSFSVIRVNESGLQELWAFNMQGKAISHLASAIEPVGYHVWLDEENLLLFVLGEPHTLQLVAANDPKQAAKLLDGNIGASLVRYKQSNWYLYSRKSEEGHWLKGYNKETRKTRRVARLPDNTDYYALSPSGYAFTSDGNNIYVRKIIEQNNKLQPLEKWEVVAIGTKACQQGVSRMAISPDESMIAMVCPRLEKAVD